MSGYSAKVEIYLVLADGTRLDVGAIGPTFARLRCVHDIRLEPGTPAETLVIVDGHEHRRKVILTEGLKAFQVKVVFTERNLSMMKSTLTPDDIPGWYECCEIGRPQLRGTRYFVVWPATDGGPAHTAVTDMVPNGQCQEFENVGKFTDFVRLVSLDEMRAKVNDTMDVLLGNAERNAGAT